MFERLKRVIVTTYIGAIALGWLFAQGLQHFANIFSAPVAGWFMRREYRGILGQANSMRGFSFQDALPELVKCVSLLLIGYLVLRWLYFTPLEPAGVESSTELE